MKMVVAGIEFDVERRWSESVHAWGEYVTPQMMDCPKCGRESKVSYHYTFTKDSFAFKCPNCGVFEWQGHKS